jgi:FMN phosphatase YigB (HAD superfamily)
MLFSGLVKRKMLVLDLDETLIHSHHDAMLRPTVKPGTPPDFVLKVTIDQHPVRFFVHKRPHVDYFLDIVSRHFDIHIYVFYHLKIDNATSYTTNYFSLSRSKPSLDLSLD